MGIILILAILYVAIIMYFFFGIFLNSKQYNTELKEFSIIVAARNEEKNIAELLQTLTNQNYPKNRYEIIIADDRSTDGTAEIVKEFQVNNSNLKLVQIKAENPEIVGKKGAISQAVKLAENPILVFTDADCLPKRNWVQEVSRHFLPEVDFVAGYSIILNKNSFFQKIKNLERSAFFAVITGAFGYNWGISATAGNMAYKKKLFEKVNGFSGISKIRSGDDDLMLHKMNAYIRKLNFMFSKDSIIFSHGCENSHQQINQETRRGSKWRYYPISIKILTLFVMVFYLFYSALFVTCCAGFVSWNLFFIITVMKIVSEFCLLTAFLKKVNQLKLMLLFPIAEIFYIPYFIFFGLKGTFGKYKWKE